VNRSRVGTPVRSTCCHVAYRFRDDAGRGLSGSQRIDLRHHAVIYAEPETREHDAVAR